MSPPAPGARCRRLTVRQRLAQRGERRRGIAEQRVIGWAVLVQLAGIDVAADHRAAANLPAPQVGITQLGADHEQRVAVRGGLLQGTQPDRGTHRERMRLVDDAFAVDRGGDRRAERLGQRGDFGLRVDGSAAGDDQRLRGSGQHLGGPAHGSRISLRRIDFRAHLGLAPTSSARARRRAPRCERAVGDRR